MPHPDYTSSAPDSTTAAERLSFYVSATTSRHLDSVIALPVLIEGIRMGRWRKEVERYRKADKTTRARLKPSTLPAFTPTGVQPTAADHSQCKAEDASSLCSLGAYRRETGTPFESRSGLVALDLDAYKDDAETRSAEAIRDIIAKTPHCAGVFVSASGEGVKALIRVDPVPQTPEQHRQAWDAAWEWMSSELRLAETSDAKDPPGSSIAHIQFVSYDRQAYLNVDAEGLPWQPQQSVSVSSSYRTDTPEPPEQRQPRREFDESDIREMLQHCDVDGSWQEYRFKIARAVRSWDNGGDRGKRLWLEFANMGTRSPHPDDYERAYDEVEGTGKGITVATLVKFAVEGGWKAKSNAANADIAKVNNFDSLMRVSQKSTLAEAASGASDDNPVTFPSEPTPLGAAWRLLKNYGPKLLLRQAADTRVLMATPEGVWAAKEDSLHKHTLEATKPWVMAQTAGTPFKDKVKHWEALQTPSGLSNAVKLCGVAYEAMLAAELVPDGLTVVGSIQMDLGRWLGAPNGVVDLATGQLLQDDMEARSKLVSQMLPDAFLPDAQNDLVDKMFAHLNEEQEQWLLESLAWSLRGSPMRRAYMIRGDADGGKTTLKEAILHSFGVYASSITNDAFKATHGNTSELSTSALLPFLDGTRLVLIDEPEERGAIVSSILKKLSGGGVIRARDLHEKARDRQITATLFMVCNTGHEPEVDTTDPAVFDRLHILDYPVFPNKSKDWRLADLFQQDAPARQAFVARVVKAGINLDHPPEAPDGVMNARMEWQSRSDGIVGQWLRQNIVRDAKARSLTLEDVVSAAKDAVGGEATTQAASAFLKKAMGIRGNRASRAGRLATWLDGCVMASATMQQEEMSEDWLT